MSKVLALVDCLRVTVLTEDGELIRELVLDPDREISAARSELTVERCPDIRRHDVARHHIEPRVGIEPTTPALPWPCSAD